MQHRQHADRPSSPPPSPTDSTVQTYQQLAEAFSGESFVFMNHGYLASPQREPSPLPRTASVHQYSVELIRHILDGVPLRGKRILDVGCGRGGTCAYLAEHAGARAVVGLDRSAENIELNRRNLRRKGLSFERGDAQRLPFRDAAFDVVTNIESSHCYRNVLLFFRQVFRVLAPGGLFCYTDCLHPLSDLAKHYLLRKVGFTVLREIDITEEVARALYANRERWKAFVKQDEPGLTAAQRRMRRHVVQVYNHKRLRQYSTRELVYKSWLLRKEPVLSSAAMFSRQRRKFHSESRSRGAQR